MARATSEQSGGGYALNTLLQFLSLPHDGTSLHNAFPPFCNLCRFSQIFASCRLDTVQTWVKLSLIAAQGSSDIHFFFLRLDGSNRFSGHLQQDCLRTFPEIFWGDLILCSLQCRKPVPGDSEAECCAVFVFFASLTFSIATSK